MINNKIVLVFFILSFMLLGSIIGYGVYDSKRPHTEFNKVIPSEDSSVQEERVTLTFVSGTEYVPNDPNGKTIVSLRDHRNNFINTTCYETILYPNRTTYIPFSVMNQDSFFGTYWVDFNSGPVQGIYDQEIFCEVKGFNVSNGKAYHVANISTIIQTAEVNVQDRLQTVIDGLNCTLTPNISVCTQLDNIADLINNSLFITINQSSNLLNFSEEVFLQINNSIIEHKTLFFDIEAPDCHVTTNWTYRVRVTDESDHILPFLTCTLESDRFGIENVPYDNNTGEYVKNHVCGTPPGVVNWNFTCERLY